MKTTVSEEIFQKYLQKPNLLEIYSNLPPGQPRLINITKKILKAAHKQCGFPNFSFEEIIKNESNKDIGAYFLFLYAWSKYCQINLVCTKDSKQETSNSSQSKILFQKAKNLENFTKQPAHQFMLIEFEAYIECSNYNISKAREIYHQLLHITKPESILYYRALYLYLDILGSESNIKEFNKHLEMIKHKKDIYHQFIYSYYKIFFDFNQDIHFDIEERCENLINDFHYLDDLGINPFIAKLNLNDIYYMHKQINSDTKNNIKNKRINDSTSKFFNIKNSSPIYENALSCSEELSRGDPKEALKKIKPYIGKNTPIALSLFIRTALANRNTEMARHYLNEKNKKLICNFIDDFYWARIHLIEDNQEQAFKFLKKCIHFAKKYQCFGRLEYEFVLASELKASNVFDLFKNYLTFSSIKLSKHMDISDIFDKTSNERSDPLRTFVGSGIWYEKIINNLNKFSNLKQTVLISGETGTGKDILAHALHDLSTQSERPFVSISCGSLQENLLETEIFGHVKGAFTGAEKAHHGLIEQAKDGTLFFDEIADMPSKIQIALLRTLENREFRPIGANQTKKVNCRIICATNKNLKEEVEKGTFRQDLFFRLTPLTLYLPPIRKRKHDIELLTQQFMKYFRKNQPAANLSEDLLEKLKSYSWPGNVRELKNEIEYMTLIDPNKSVYRFEDLREEFSKSILKSLLSEKDKETIKTKKPNGNPYQGLVRNDRLKEELKKMFLTQNQLTRIEICKILNISHTTASKYLKILCDEKFIEKITPSGSSRFNYFVCRSKLTHSLQAGFQEG